MEFDDLSNKVIGCAIEVHRIIGPGLLESAYEKCLSCELTHAGIRHEMQKGLPIEYKELKLDCGYRVDVMIENKLIVELKSVSMINDVHKAQLLTYMKLSGIKIGLLLNFNTKLLTENGIKRFVL